MVSFENGESFVDTPTLPRSEEAQQNKDFDIFKVCYSLKDRRSHDLLLSTVDVVLTWKYGEIHIEKTNEHKGMIFRI